MIEFDLQKLLADVFAPSSDERVTILTDLPHNGADHLDWRDRREMAADWLSGFDTLGVETNPLLSFPATGAHNSDLPEVGEMGGKNVQLEKVVGDSNILIAMTEFSATAALSRWIQHYPALRGASMPQVLRRMEHSALAADYNVVAYKANILKDLLQGSDQAYVRFSTGDEMLFDLRFRNAHADDGICRPEKQALRLINLPSGEAFSVPYEGEVKGESSRTEGTIPVDCTGERVHFHVRQNIIEQVTGDNDQAERMRAYFDVDLARRNVAELGLGCNDRAVITGNVLEDEKAGFHWAYGRSEHLDGKVGPGAFQRPQNVVHQDVVYAPGCPIEVDEVRLGDTLVISEGAYVIF